MTSLIPQKIKIPHPLNPSSLNPSIYFEIPHPSIIFEVPHPSIPHLSIIFEIPQSLIPQEKLKSLIPQKKVQNRGIEGFQNILRDEGKNASLVLIQNCFLI